MKNSMSMATLLLALLAVALAPIARADSPETSMQPTDEWQQPAEDIMKEMISEALANHEEIEDALNRGAKRV